MEMNFSYNVITGQSYYSGPGEKTRAESRKDRRGKKTRKSNNSRPRWRK